MVDPLRAEAPEQEAPHRVLAHPRYHRRSQSLPCRTNSQIAARPAQVTPKSRRLFKGCHPLDAVQINC